MNRLSHYSKLIKENLCEKLNALSTLKVTLDFLKRKLLRYKLNKPDWRNYVDKGFSWISGQYAQGLLSVGDKKSIRTLTRFYNRLMWVKRLGIPVFEVPDQIIHAQVLLGLYISFGKKQYRPLIEEAAVLLKSIASENEGLIIYWPPDKELLVDTLGMISDFCYDYDKVFGKTELAEIAKRQLEYTEENCIDSSCGLPYHSHLYIEKKNGGSSTWGRGIGWYLLGLTAYVKNCGSKEKRLEQVLESLFSQQDSEGFLYNDFEKPTHIDSSTTCMAALCLAEWLVNDLLEKEQEDKLSECLVMSVKALTASTNEKGEVLNCSGECNAAGEYSEEYGNYFSQGYTLELLSLIKSNKKLSRLFDVEL